MATMFGCCRFASASASARNRCKSVELASGPLRSTFTATRRLRLIWRALKTTPIPPRAISSSSSYSPHCRGNWSSGTSGLTAPGSRSSAPRKAQTAQRLSEAWAGEAARHFGQRADGGIEACLWSATNLILRRKIGSDLEQNYGLDDLNGPPGLNKMAPRCLWAHLPFTSLCSNFYLLVLTLFRPPAYP